jgi:hypothetical protein
MQKLKTKNPVLPNGGTKPVVVTETTLNQNQLLRPGTLCGGEHVCNGTLCGGEEIRPGTLHGGEEIKPGTLHGGEEIKPGTLHGGEEIRPGTLHGGEEIKPGTLHRGEEIKPGTLHSSSYAPASYRTKDASGVYKFRFIRIGSKFEIDIDSQPSYAGRDERSTIAHRLPSTRGGKKICLSYGKEPKDLESAKKICMEWAELTQTYIKTGASIDKQVMAKSNPINKLRSHLMN